MIEPQIYRAKDHWNKWVVGYLVKSMPYKRRGVKGYQQEYFIMRLPIIGLQLRPRFTWIYPETLEKIETPKDFILPKNKT